MVPEGVSSFLECDQAIGTKDDNVLSFVDADNVKPIKSVVGKASADQLKQEQLSDEALAGCWRMASRGEGSYFV